MLMITSKMKQTHCHDAVFHTHTDLLFVADVVFVAVVVFFVSPSLLVEVKQLLL